MAKASAEGDYVTLGSAKFWYSPVQRQIHMTINDADLNGVSTGGNPPKSGMRVVFSPRPRSANFHAVNFNRAAEVLRAHGKSAPDFEADETIRRRGGAED